MKTSFRFLAKYETTVVFIQKPRSHFLMLNSEPTVMSEARRVTSMPTARSQMAENN
jgi:hypothetical protein